MKRYGQSITWSALNAPQLFTGDCQSYSLRDAVTEQEIEDASSDIAALVLHSRKAALSFEAQVNASSTNFLDLSGGAAVAVSTITTGTVLCTEAVENWRLQQPKTASITGTWFPDIVLGAGVSAGTGVNLMTPDQSALGLILPGGKIIYGTYGLGHAAGIVQSLSLRQMLKITEDDPNPDGTIKGATTHGYKRTISMELLANAGASKPAVNTTLVITGAPDTASSFVITSSDERWAKARGKMFAVEASWIPAMGS